MYYLWQGWKLLKIYGVVTKLYPNFDRLLAFTLVLPFHIQDISYNVVKMLLNLISVQRITKKYMICINYCKHRIVFTIIGFPITTFKYSIFCNLWAICNIQNLLACWIHLSMNHTSTIPGDLERSCGIAF